MTFLLKKIMQFAVLILTFTLGLCIYLNHSLYVRQQAALNDPKANEPTTAEIRLAWAGDILCHGGLNTEAYDGVSYDYTTVMTGAARYIENADLAVCTLETTFPDVTEYTGSPMFKSPKGLAASMSRLGFDLVSTASEHCMDSMRAGITETLDVLEENGLDHVGTYRSQAERDANHGVTVKEAGGISIAFLSYTYGTNGLSVEGFEYAVNLLHTDYLTTQSNINYTQIESDLSYARSLEPDLIVVFMHWGYEYNTVPTDYQRVLTKYLFEQGVDLILGGHTHAPQPMEVRRVTGPDGREKTGYVCYCLGNFVSCQNDPYTNLSAVVELTLEKNLRSGDAYLKNVSYAPVFMVDLDDYGIEDAGWRYRLWDLHAAIDAYENGNDLGVINNTLYDAMCQGLEDIHAVFGAEYDMFDKSYTPNTEGEMPVPGMESVTPRPPLFEEDTDPEADA